MGAAISCPATPNASTVAGRIRLVRNDLHMAQWQFARFLSIRSGRVYAQDAICRLEHGKRIVQLADIEAIAAIDPLHRGASWLAFGGER